MDVYSDEKPGHGLDELLQRPDIEAVIVLLPILVGPDVDVETGRALIADYENTYVPRNLVYSVAEQFRYDTGFVKASEIVARGKIANNTRPPGAMLLGTRMVLLWMLASTSLLWCAWLRDRKLSRPRASRPSSHLTYGLSTLNAALRFSKGAQVTLSISYAAAMYIMEFVFIRTSGVLTVKCAGLDSTLRMKGADLKPISKEVFKADGIKNKISAFVHAAVVGKGDKVGSPREALTDVAVIESICSGGGLVRSHGKI
ncbi:hypothetical protein EMCG_01528 [[Emmonsia] crescens]|uniref:Uncharacterized protein n=1 Tax=[Emmonsia] crescens TaxID=73230 RepID=A0A0G2I1Z0_9EURO|nr:hypothetical protein EMCG_01528 [Emmonsia crescens UAMH 3008]